MRPSAMYLEELADNIHLENEKYEAKALLNRGDIVSWLKSIAGFANASGGEFFIGVEDKTNKLIGFNKKNADNERNYFNNQINEHLTPRPKIKISFISYKINNNERFILKATVEESAVKPVILKYKNVPAIYMRRDGFTNGATYEEIIEMSIKSKNTQYDMLVSESMYDWNNLSDLRTFYSNHNKGADLKEKALKSLGFVNEDGHLLNGAVLFADNYNDKKTEIQCSVFSGFNKGSERIVTINK